MFDRDRKMAKDNFGRKRKATGCLYLSWSGFREAKGHFSMRSCLQDAVINSIPIIGNFMNKQELCRQFPPRRVRDSNISEIENNSCVRNVMKVTPAFNLLIILTVPQATCSIPDTGVTFITFLT